MSFKVIKAGIFTTLQDRGRFGFTHLGVTNSGVMDEYSALAAQKLLDNAQDTNILEITFAPVELKADANTSFCVTGALCEVFINEQLKNSWQVHKIQKGDVVKVQIILEGQRVYLAVKNGFDIAKEFGSNSTTIKESLGGISGIQIKNADILPYKQNSEDIINRWHENHIPKYEKELVLRVILSYQEESFSKEEKEKFFNSTYTITQDFNRMACKLSGEKILSSLDGIISEAITFGSIQIPKDGQPIILLKERQTIGGYPKIGTVLSIDCFKLAQMRIDTKVRFEPIDINTAQDKLRDFYSTFA
ncbi:biotin-dependent carboxyltransferase family protein [Sulfurimonas sp.]|uniref:5-oxoprolinase subunit C family protein n=1 Tax=Sulfurimonas sp. TaxID=2022749 RepID=UPI0025EC44DE|nr:biotin-dependent carboxyltransferase family protein [Sulfurimonas sp.]